MPTATIPTTVQPDYDDGNGAAITNPLPDPDTARNKLSITLGLHVAGRLATRARRVRATRCLEVIRNIGRQLAALDPRAIEAPAVIDAATRALTHELRHIAELEAAR